MVGLPGRRGELARQSKPITPAGKLVTKWVKEYFGADEDGVPAQAISIDIEFDTNDPVPVCLRKHHKFNCVSPIAIRLGPWPS
jgi:hypothetical protein